ncbi:MAG: putative bifunctional diguanylate cyclase/phosphodiesterase [Burkholderiales bacterium]
MPAHSPGPSNPGQPDARFRLLRYFSLTSLVGVIGVVAALLMFYRHIAYDALMAHQTQANVTVARIFANTIWPKYSDFLNNSDAVPAGELARQAPMAELRRDILRQMRGLDVAKVKIYNLAGLTMFSTDPKQIGEDKRDNLGFQGAKAGTTMSDITFRHNFDAFERTIADRNLVSSYVPIRRDELSSIEAVLEVYSDVSPLVWKLEITQWQIAGAVLGSLSLLYFFLYLIVRRADRIIDEQAERDRAASRKQLEHQARHDALTGLPNRTSFTERLEEVIKRARRTNTNVAVLFVELDHFKYINDSLGHVVGDRLLCAVGDRLVSAVRETDSVARFGGDEYAVLVSDMRRIDDAARVAQKVRAVIADEAYDIDGAQLRVNASVGISVYPFDGADAVGLIRSADAALYHAKEVGRDNFQFFTQDMNAKAFAVLSMERDLREAVKESQFLLHFQPQIELATGRVIGGEALIRWQHPQHGLVPPGRFIPFAEERALIVPIGEWVLRATCRQIRAWRDAGLPVVPLGVNVSALQFRQHGFRDTVAAVLEETGVGPECLELEMTESVMMHGAESSTAIIGELKSMGLKLAMDDFGTGYSSLSYLKRFPIDRVKLDRSFVEGLPWDADDAAIAIAVLGMANALQLKVVAEGVETPEQLELLKSWGCHEAQGFYFSKPLPADEFIQFVMSSSALARSPAKARALSLTR